MKTFSADIRFSLQVSLPLHHITFFSKSPASLSHSLVWQMSVESVKEKLWKKCGTSVNSMHLELYDDSNSKISDLSNNSTPLGFYSPLDGSVSIFNIILHSPLIHSFIISNHGFCGFASGAAFVCMSQILTQHLSLLVVGWRTLHWSRNTPFLKKLIISVKACFYICILHNPFSFC